MRNPIQAPRNLRRRKKNNKAKGSRILFGQRGSSNADDVFLSTRDRPFADHQFARAGEARRNITTYSAGVSRAARVGGVGGAVSGYIQIQNDQKGIRQGVRDAEVVLADPP